MADMHTPLKPCPHCGNSTRPSIKVWDGDGFPGFEARCDASGFDGQDGRGCGAASGWGETPEEAAAAWNRRVPSQDAETIKALREQIATKDAALAPFARCSEVYPDALPETAAAFASLHDPRCPLTVGDFHAARAALAGSAS